ncbi:hypothetical protein WG908_01050 [Sphingobium sp. AN641]|uniref:hypothetical protein n=1 Tax=Sphingobium sp. AN641 TaxID=3133443 RepID=UPI0030BD9197
MSAPLSFTAMADTDDWPVASIMAGVSTAPLRHALDLARFFPGHAPALSDIMLFETRRHLAGCLAATEIALRQALVAAPSVAPILTALPDAIVWPAIQAHPALLSSSLLSHMRLRAGVSLMLRQQGHAADEEDLAADSLDLTTASDPAISECAVALTLAEGRWTTPGAEGAPMRPDLPAEQFVDLIWTAAAPFCAALARTGMVVQERALAAVETGARMLMSQQDESNGAIAIADRLVRLLGQRADAPALLAAALAQRQMLFFAALAARRVRLDTSGLLGILLDGPLVEVAAICHLLGGSASDYRLLLLTLQPARAGLSDAVILAEAERFDAMPGAQADAIVATLRAPKALRAGLALIDRTSAAGASAG